MSNCSLNNPASETDDASQPLRFAVNAAHGGAFYWVLETLSGDMVAMSKTYSTKIACLESVQVIMARAGQAVLQILA